MSLMRTALRLGVVNALRAHPVIAARVAERIYDSRIDNFNYAEVVPVITVTSEEHHGEPFSRNNGGPPFQDECNLVLEIAQVSATANEDGSYDIDTPLTDAELETELDLLEHCAVEAMASANTDARRLLGKAVLRRFLDYKSSRFGTNETGNRFAIRLVTLRAELHNEGARDARTPPPGPYGGLPEPLRLVCEAAPDGTFDKLTCDHLAELLPPPAAMQPWSRLAFAPVADPSSNTRPPVEADFPTQGTP